MVSIYGLTLVLHIASIAVAFGAVASQPLLLRTVRRDSPGSVAALVRAQRRLGNAVVAPAATLALVTGAVLATLGGFWSELWVSLPLSLLIYVLGLHGAFVVPTERRLEALAAQLAGPPGGDAPVSRTLCDAVARRLATANYLSSLAILLALGLMVLKP